MNRKHHQRKKCTVWLCLMFLIACSGISATQANELIDLGEMPVDKYQRSNTLEPDFLFGYVSGVTVRSERIVGENRGFTVPLPLFGINYKDVVYWNVLKGGAWLWKSRDWRFKFGPVVRLRPAVNIDNDGELTGLRKRKGSLETGLGLSWFGYVKTSLEMYQDFSGRSNGASAQLRFSKFVRVNDHISAIPSLALAWLSDEVVGYYYGVGKTESAATGIVAYQGRSTTNARVGITVADHLTRNWAVLGGVMYQRYGAGITQSPLVTKNANTLFYLGASYIFLKF